ncbi:hypothetical protein JB92DRAFT_1335125 [Gautieria morchelliformis]|nr:hypothetical protein JB92DRAFT_1335125 [Gautieria morchelliformis]
MVPVTIISNGAMNILRYHSPLLVEFDMSLDDGPAASQMAVPHTISYVTPPHSSFNVPQWHAPTHGPAASQMAVPRTRSCGTQPCSSFNVPQCMQPSLRVLQPPRWDTSPYGTQPCSSFNVPQWHAPLPTLRVGGRPAISPQDFLDLQMSLGAGVSAVASSSRLDARSACASLYTTAVVPFCEPDDSDHPPTVRRRAKKIEEKEPCPICFQGFTSLKRHVLNVQGLVLLSPLLPRFGFSF